MTSRYRSQVLADKVIGLSISYEREHLLARGLGIEHLRELLIGLARPLLRQGASLAYAGHWRETEDNFTFNLLRLISAEQEDNSLGGPDISLVIGRLYNHSAWPFYLEITPRIEAQWINCCRIVRITQQHAGIGEADLVADGDASSASDRTIFNKAVVLSTMRRLAATGMRIPIPDVLDPEPVPPAAARIALGGRMEGFSGFLPGIYEEALLTLEGGCPLYLLGGFGGAAEPLARAFLDVARPPELTAEWLQARNSKLLKLDELVGKLQAAPWVRSTADALEALDRYFAAARSDLTGVLKTGLDRGETEELLTTCDIERAVHLVVKGLENRMNLSALPA